MHEHSMTMKDMHRGLDGLELPISVEITLRHDHGPISNMEDHDHPVTVAVTQEEATVTLQHSAPFPTEDRTA